MLRRLGELDCLVVDALGSTSPTVAVVLLHGYGAPGDDLAPIASELLQTDAAIRDSVRFYVPQAIVGLDDLGLPDGRAWWHLDMNRLVMAAQLGRWDGLRQEVPAGLSAARDAILGMVDAISQETMLPKSRLVLAGFSQGAMLCTDAALHLEESVAALCLASGSLIAEAEWAAFSRRARSSRRLDEPRSSRSDTSVRRFRSPSRSLREERASRRVSAIFGWPHDPMAVSECVRAAFGEACGH